MVDCTLPVVSTSRTRWSSHWSLFCRGSQVLRGAQALTCGRIACVPSTRRRARLSASRLALAGSPLSAAGTSSKAAQCPITVVAATKPAERAANPAVVVILSAKQLISAGSRNNCAELHARRTEHYPLLTLGVLAAADALF